MASDPLNLGPVIVNARRVSLARTARTLGNFYFFVVGPIGYLFIALLTPMFVIQAVPPAIAPPVYIVTAVLIYVGFFSYFYVFPQGDFLTLHENGIHIRRGLKRRAISFASIRSVFTGEDELPVSGVPAWMDRRSPEIIKIQMQINRNTLTVTTQDNKRHVFGALLARFEPTDLEHFFVELVSRAPHVVGSK